MSSRKVDSGVAAEIPRINRTCIYNVDYAKPDEIITLHSPASIHTALLSDKCVSCKEYASFQFLPICEWCCCECLRRDPSLQVLIIRMTGICFGVSPKDLTRIPTMFNIPGTYSVGYTNTCRKRVKLVSLK